MSKIITFLPAEATLIGLCEAVLEKNNSEALSVVQKRIVEIHQLAQIANNAASLSGEGRTWETLARKLSHQGIVEVVNQPLKAVVGRSFLIGKLHLFGYMEKLAAGEQSLQPLVKEAVECRHELLFLLLAEDLYTAAIADSKGDEPWLEAASYELIQMWETRTNCATPEFASDLRRLWDVRQTVAPVFGTMQGTMEVMRHLLGLSGAWHSFIETIASDPAVARALEEYLFSLSYEQVVRLRQYMEERGVHSIGRKEVAQWLGLDDAKLDGNGEGSAALHLYRSFLRRQSAARVRRRSRMPGPTRTLEEHFVIFLLSRKE